MAKPRAKPNPKKLEQAELKELNAIQITLVASEMNLQRIAALLLFADHLQPKLIEKEAVRLPWEEEGAEPPKIQIDRRAVENDVAKQLELYVQKHGRDKAVTMIQSFGQPRVGLLPDEQLLDLYHALAGEAASE
jgi:hypothetical protein